MRFIVELMFQLCLIPFRCFAWLLFESPRPKRRKSYYVKKGRAPAKYKPYKQPKFKPAPQPRQFYTKKDGTIARNRDGTPKYRRNKKLF